MRFYNSKSFSYLLALTLGLLIVSHSLVSFAQTTPVKEKSPIDSKYDTKAHKDRMRRLDWIEFLLNDLNSVIPNPSPDEIKWVEAEQKEIDQVKDAAMTKDRKGRLYTSIPYTERDAKTLLNTGLSWVAKIKQTTHVDEEMIYWTQLAAVITDSSTLFDSIEALKTKIPEKSINSSYFNAGVLSSEGRGILWAVIIPYLCSVSPTASTNFGICFGQP